MGAQRDYPLGTERRCGSKSTRTREGVVTVVLTGLGWLVIIACFVAIWRAGVFNQEDDDA